MLEATNDVRFDTFNFWDLLSQLMPCNAHMVPIHCGNFCPIKVEQKVMVARLLPILYLQFNNERNVSRRPLERFVRCVLDVMRISD